MEKSTLNHRFRCRITILLKQMVFQRAGINADTNRNSPFFTCLDNRFNLFTATNITWINADFVHAILNSQQALTDDRSGYQQQAEYEFVS